MALNSGKIVVVGCGPGSPLYLTAAARQAVARADVLAGSRRLQAMFAEHPGERIVTSANLSALLDRVADARAAGRSVAVLVSGDPGLFSLAAKVVRRFGREHCELVPGVSSVQVAFARVGQDWADARILSAHAGLPQVTVEELAPYSKLAILAGTAQAVQWAAEIADGLGATHAAVLCENLTLDDERIRHVASEALRQIEASSLAIVLLLARTDSS